MWCQIVPGIASTYGGPPTHLRISCSVALSRFGAVQQLKLRQRWGKDVDDVYDISSNSRTKSGS